MRVVRPIEVPDVTLVHPRDIPHGRFARNIYSNRVFLKLSPHSLIVFEDQEHPRIHLSNNAEFEVLPESYEITLGGEVKYIVDPKDFLAPAKDIKPLQSRTYELNEVLGGE